MIGIEAIGSYIPRSRIDNLSFGKERFDLDKDFLENKIGVRARAIREGNESVLDMCVASYNDLMGQVEVDPNTIDAIVLVGQNPDVLIPHTSAIIHNKLGLSPSAACFDLSHGCAGYIYGLSILSSFMRDRGCRRGLLFTCDPYSKIVNEDDKNTSLIFGDAASVTLLSENPKYVPTDFSFGSMPNAWDKLVLKEGKLHMDGRAIYNFVMRYVCTDVVKVLGRNSLSQEDIGLFLFHQGSKYVVDSICKGLELPKSKVPFEISEYGNTVSSSIPLMLKNHLHEGHAKLLLSGFGVGLSWGTALLGKGSE